MKDVFSIEIAGNPTSWQRMRMDPRRKNKRGIPRQYMDPENQHAMDRIRDYLWAAGARGDVSRTSLWEISGLFLCETFHRRDLDRLVSLVMDAAIGVVYEDDSQVRRFKQIDWTPGAPKGEGSLTITFRKIGEDARPSTGKRKTLARPVCAVMRRLAPPMASDGEDP